MVFSHVGSFHDTPQRSLRLLARHSEKPSATILTLVRMHLRRFVEENEGKSVSQSGTTEIIIQIGEAQVLSVVSKK